MGSRKSVCSYVDLNRCCCSVGALCSAAERCCKGARCLGRALRCLLTDSQDLGCNWCGQVCWQCSHLRYGVNRGVDVGRTKCLVENLQRTLNLCVRCVCEKTKLLCCHSGSASECWGKWWEKWCKDAEETTTTTTAGAEACRVIGNCLRDGVCYSTRNIWEDVAAIPNCFVHDGSTCLEQIHCEERGGELLAEDHVAVSWVNYDIKFLLNF